MWTWRELRQRTAALAARLREEGVGEGDVVGAVLPNIPEAIAGLLATASIGAIWSICSPDLAPKATLDRLGPLEPVVLLGTAGYTFKGRRVETLPPLAEMAAALPTVRKVLVMRCEPDDRLTEVPRAEPIDVATLCSKLTPYA